MKRSRFWAAVSLMNIAAGRLFLHNRPAFRPYLGQLRLEYYRRRELGPRSADFYAVFPECQTLAEPVRLIAELTAGGLTKAEIYYLAVIARGLRPQRIFEIGTFDGCAAAHFALNTDPQAQAIVFTLDLPPKTAEETVRFSETEREFLDQMRPAYYIRKYDPNKAVQLLYGDSMSYDFSPYYGQIDLVFVDGNHSRAFVDHDSREALRMLRPGGTILWHDYYGVPGEDVSDVLMGLAAEYPIRRIKDTALAVYRSDAGTASL